VGGVTAAKEVAGVMVSGGHSDWALYKAGMLSEARATLALAASDTAAALRKDGSGVREGAAGV